MTPQKKQEIWRQKQLYIFYGSGRPIFQMNKHNEHLRKYRDPQFFYYLKSKNPSEDLRYFTPNRHLYEIYQSL